MAGRRDAEEGTALVVTTLAAVCVLLLGIVVADLAVLLRSVGQARAAADAVVLGAAATHDPRHPDNPWRVAADLADAAGATLDWCECTRRQVRAQVSVTVRSRLLERLGIDRVHASASADLVEDDLVSSQARPRRGRLPPGRPAR